ncbi:hypothetical protein EJB05_03192 [Eragrostis curvula]|uniref:RING-type E3 ubiquitin transferase n=1 Tax=Eragrostis curvula TaxID=38414 RepID=A0A5J9WU85_9POAL|nr:hypothetical protein EJB05_03192 [Eragrostis curvula]
MASRDAAESPRSAPRRPGTAAAPKDGGAGGLLSPRFRSAAAQAGWDEESILLATLIVEDTPVRESRRKRRLSTTSTAGGGGGGGSTGSNTRKRRCRRQATAVIPPVVLALDDDDKPDNAADGKKEVKEKEAEKAVVVGKEEASGSGEKAAAAGKLPCMDRLQEELSCAICLEICFEPSTTPCGHSNSRSCTINTVLWNTIQLLFPSEVEARRTSIASSSSCNNDVSPSPPRSNSYSQGGMRTRNSSGALITEGRTRSSYRNFVTPGTTTSGNTSGNLISGQGRTTRNNTSGSFISAPGRTRDSNSRSGFIRASQLVTNRSSARSDQSDDAALAYRLQQEEFMNAFETEEVEIQERQP